MRIADRAAVEQLSHKRGETFAYERGSNRPAALYRLREGRETIFFPGMLRAGQTGR